MSAYRRFTERDGHAVLCGTGDLRACCISGLAPLALGPRLLVDGDLSRISRVTCLRMRRVTCVLCLSNPAVEQAREEDETSKNEDLSTFP